MTGSLLGLAAFVAAVFWGRPWLIIVCGFIVYIDVGLDMAAFLIK